MIVALTGDSVLVSAVELLAALVVLYYCASRSDVPLDLFLFLVSCWRSLSAGNRLCTGMGVNKLSC